MRVREKMIHAHSHTHTHMHNHMDNIAVVKGPHGIHIKFFEARDGDGLSKCERDKVVTQVVPKTIIFLHGCLPTIFIPILNSDELFPRIGWREERRVYCERVVTGMGMEDVCVKRGHNISLQLRKRF